MPSYGSNWSVGQMVGSGRVNFWLQRQCLLVAPNHRLRANAGNTRPLGAAVGDFLDKPLDHGGLALSRPIATAVLAAAIIILIAVLPQKSGGHPGGAALDG